MDDVSDAVLVQRARTGDRAAFAGLYDRHVRPVYWQAYGVVADRTLAEDVTQDVFITAWQKRHDLTVDDSALPWLLVTARYTALNARRGDRRRALRSTELDDDLPADETVEQSVVDGIVRAEIDKAVGTLAPTDRQLYELCLDGDLTYAQAAEQLGLSHAAVRNRLSRLRTRLRSDLRSLRETS